MIQNFFSQPHIVIGMHRSGTSMLSGLLHSAGVFMGNDWRRNQESYFFQQINDQLLHQNGLSWLFPGVPTGSDKIRLSSSQLIARYVRAQSHPAQLFRLMAGGAWGWKDPRNTFTLDCWLKVFPQAKIIHIYRNGMDVALSLYKRNKKKSGGVRHEALKTKTAGLDLWEKYVAQAFSFESVLGAQMLTIQFEKLVFCDKMEVEKLEDFTGLSLRSRIESNADRTRTARFMDNEHEDLVFYARKNQWMKKLGYC
ncbi:MAG TPA: sulfotransferase [Verrucomicrobiae bacterium]|nr:sulfotransferase [Verrucomicrobiae bacterium]